VPGNGGNSPEEGELVTPQQKGEGVDGVKATRVYRDTKVTEKGGAAGPPKAMSHQPLQREKSGGTNETAVKKRTERYLEKTSPFPMGKKNKSEGKNEERGGRFRLRRMTVASGKGDPLYPHREDVSSLEKKKIEGSWGGRKRV